MQGVQHRQTTINKHHHNKLQLKNLNWKFYINTINESAWDTNCKHLTPPLTPPLQRGSIVATVNLCSGKGKGLIVK